MKTRNAEYKDRVEMEEREITTAEVYYRVAIFLWFATTNSTNMAWFYGLTTFLIFSVGWHELKQYLYHLNIFKRETHLEFNIEESESSLEAEHNQDLSRSAKLRKILSYLKIKDAEHQNNLSHKDKQMMAFALHYGLAFISLALLEASKDIQNIAIIFMIAFVSTLIQGDVQIILFHSRVPRRETSIYDIRQKVENLLAIEATNYIEYSIKLGELKYELKMHDEENQSLTTLKARKVRALQRYCARIIFFITPYDYSLYWSIFIDYLIGYLSSKDKVSRKLMKIWKDFTANN